MCGRGSGRRASFGLMTTTTNDYHAIDLAWLCKKGCLAPGYCGKITWSRGDTKTGWIGYRTESAGLRLMYRTRRHGGDWRDVDELIPFVYSRTNFPGRRAWFHCPSCCRRCRVLYGGAYFRCRKCHGLRYESQYETGYSRAASQSHKLRERLGYSGSLDDPFPPKPKGMHWKTYERLRARDDQLQMRWCRGVADWLARTRR